MISRRQITWIASVAFASAFAFSSTFAACGGDCPEGKHQTCNAKESGPAARIGEQEISWAQLEDRASEPLQQLDIQRQQVLEGTLTQLIDERLIEMEADRRGTTADSMLHDDILSKIVLTEAEIDAWYKANQARIRKPKEEVAGQIRDLLINQKSQSMRQELITDLRSKHSIQTLLEPFRADFSAFDGVAGPSKGSDGAPIEVTVFSDFQCPYCRNIAPVMDQLVETYGEKVQLKFRQFPLTSIHPRAMKAAEVTACAQAQGKFWDLHDAIFENFGQLEDDQLMTRAADVGMDLEALGSCLDSGEARQAVEQDLKLGRSVGVGSTPSIFVNGRPVMLKGRVPPLDQIATVVNDEVGRLR